MPNCRTTTIIIRNNTKLNLYRENIELSNGKWKQHPNEIIPTQSEGVFKSKSVNALSGNKGTVNYIIRNDGKNIVLTFKWLNDSFKGNKSEIIVPKEYEEDIYIEKSVVEGTMYRVYWTITSSLGQNECEEYYNNELNVSIKKDKPITKSILFEIDNQTNYTLIRKVLNDNHTAWKKYPPEKILPKSLTTMNARGNIALSGPRGMIEYKLEGTDSNFQILFHNPVIGKANIKIIESKNSLCKIESSYTPQKDIYCKIRLLPMFENNEDKFNGAHGIFGLPIHVVLEKEKCSSKVPKIVKVTVENILLQIKDIEKGIWNKPGKYSEIVEIVELLNSLSADKLDIYSVHSLCHVMKMFLRELNPSLIPNELINSFIGIKYTENPLENFKKFIFSLPDGNRQTFQMIVDMLYILHKSDKEEYPSINLAVVFGQLFFPGNQKASRDVSIFVSEALMELIECYGRISFE